MIRNISRTAAAGTMARAALCATLLGVCLSVQARSDAPQQLHVVLRDGQLLQPAGQRLQVRQGTEVEIHWQSNEPGELHLEGYDITIALPAGEVVTSRFRARASGRFPVVSHGFGPDTGRVHGRRALLYLEVHPD